MKSYSIFAIVLTVVYLIYYAVVIVQDLYGKKGTDKRDEEFFDLGAPDDDREQSVDVMESETGFSIGSEEYEMETTPVVLPATQEGAVTGDGEAAVAERLERLKAAAEERMEETVPYLSDACTADELYRAMICKGRPDSRPELAWNPLKDRL